LLYFVQFRFGVLTGHRLPLKVVGVFIAFSCAASPMPVVCGHSPRIYHRETTKVASAPCPHVLTMSPRPSRRGPTQQTNKGGLVTATATRLASSGPWPKRKAPPAFHKCERHMAPYTAAPSPSAGNQGSLKVPPPGQTLARVDSRPSATNGAQLCLPESVAIATKP
jgi:hypothetical protein